MSDSVDRVFVHALATVRRLPRTGSSRPPPSARLQLYGLYKQSMEGDVSSILPRPTLPPNSPDLTKLKNQGNNSVHRYASRDLRTREAQAEIEKWDAWHACKGMSRTEAKRRYITTLIETMKEYASGTTESRELISELEFVWNQIRSQSGSDESEEGESPTRRLERAGLKRPDALRRSVSPGPGGGDSSGSQLLAEGNALFSRLEDSSESQRNQQTSRSERQKLHQGLRVLSPTSHRGSDDIIENEEDPSDPASPAELAEVEHEAAEDDEDEYESASEDKLDKRPSPLYHPPNHDPNQPSNPSPQPPSPSRPSSSRNEWRTQIESTLRQLTLELTALREQLSQSSMLSRSSFSHPFSSLPIPSHFPLRKRILIRISMTLRWVFWVSLRQTCIQLGLLVFVMVLGRIRGDRRVEDWCREKVGEFVSWARYIIRGAEGKSDLTNVIGRLRIA